MLAKRQIFKLHATHLEVFGVPTFPEWQEFGDTLRRIAKGHQWWWGDWLLFGEGAYGERFSQALEATGWEAKTIMQYARVCRDVPAAERSEDVPFSHYANGLSALGAPERAEWVALITTEDLTQQQFVRSLRASRGTPEKPVVFWVVVSCTDEADLEAFTARMEAEGRKVKAR